MPVQLMRQFEKVCEILDNHGRDKGKLIPILQAVQEEYRYLPEEVLNYIATSLAVSPAKVYGVATFYAHFTLKPKGKYVVQLCDGTACHVKKSTALLDALYKKLNLNEKNPTTKDMLFTVETVACLGACALAPVMVVNGEVYAKMTPERAVEVIAEIVKKEREASA